jgi:hypothetical protein
MTCDPPGGRPPGSPSPKVLAPEAKTFIEVNEMSMRKRPDRSAPQGVWTIRTRNQVRESNRLTEKETQGSNVHGLAETPRRRNGLDRWLKTLKPDDVGASNRNGNRKVARPPAPSTEAKIPGSAKTTDNGKRAGSPRRERRETAAGEGKSFEGCSRRWERPNPKNPRGNGGRSPKHGEPKDWQRGAINPQGSLRSKPSGR